jgi:purine-binding chemotaxis protein CheW
LSETFNPMTDKILIFTLDELSFAVYLSTVVKIIHSVEVRYLPEAPEIICGIINFHGMIIPVADVRKRYGLPSRETEIYDRLIIADTGKRKIALPVDTVGEIKDLASLEFVKSEDILPFAENLCGVVKVDNGLVLIYDLERFLSLDEEKELDIIFKTKIQ